MVLENDIICVMCRFGGWRLYVDTLLKSEHSYAQNASKFAANIDRKQCLTIVL